MSSEATDSTALYEIWAWLEVNKKRLITWAVVVGILAFFISLAVYLKKQKQIEASAALIKVTTPGAAAENARPTVAELLKVIADYPSTAAAERASMLAAVTQFSEQKYPEALDQFRRFQNAYGSSQLMPQAAVGIAACLESQDKIEDALRAYQEVVNKYPTSGVVPQAKHALGRLNEDKKQYEQAVKFYQDITATPTSRTFWYSDAMDRLQQLYLQHPNLAPKPVAAAPMATALTNAAPSKAPAVESTNKSGPAKPAAAK
jgi:predicted negative regulator of RcsB-dependent stress response